MNHPKHLFPIAVVIAAGSAALFVSGCGNQTSTPPPNTANNPPAAATNNVLYTCEMHPEFVTNQPGSCPICGMKLVPKK